MISSDVEYWIKCIDLFDVKNKVSNRPLLIWGAYSKAHILCEALEDKKILVAGYIDGHKDIKEYLGKAVYKPDDILWDKKYYVLIAIEGIRSEIKNYLKDWHYVRDDDYFYFSEHTPDIKISSFVGEYRDIYNNHFIYKGDGCVNIDIHCIGGDNTVVIGKSFNGTEGITLKLSFGSKIMLGKDFISHGDVIIDTSMGGKIKIGDGVNIMTNTNINAKYSAELEIGNYVTAGERLFLTSGTYSKVSIGNDCMLSHDISIHGTNGHSIIDLKNKTNHAVQTEKPIKIGNHVWIGKSSSILYGTEIGDGSIVGAGSILKGKYPSKSIIAGNIAKVVREDCTWDRRREIDFEEL